MVVSQTNTTNPLQKSLKLAQQYFTSPYKSLDIFALIGILILLLSIPLTAVAVNRAGTLKIQAEATLSVTPNPAPSGSYIVIEGNGFDGNATLLVGKLGDIPYQNITTDANGSFVLPYPNPVVGPCMCLIEAWGYGKGGKVELLATTTVEVFGPSNEGDLNGDGVVNIFDLSILLSNWGATGGIADLNNDGTVNIFDLSILLSNWDG
jgi:hypothetical protein